MKKFPPTLVCILRQWLHGKRFSSQRSVSGYLRAEHILTTMKKSTVTGVEVMLAELYTVYPRRSSRELWARWVIVCIVIELLELCTGASRSIGRHLNTPRVVRVPNIFGLLSIRYWGNNLVNGSIWYVKCYQDSIIVDYNNTEMFRNQINENNRCYRNDVLPCRLNILSILRGCIYYCYCFVRY